MAHADQAAGLALHDCGAVTVTCAESPRSSFTAKTLIKPSPSRLSLPTCSDNAHEIESKILNPCPGKAASLFTLSNYSS